MIAAYDLPLAARIVREATKDKSYRAWLSQSWRRRESNPRGIPHVSEKAT